MIRRIIDALVWRPILAILSRVRPSRRRSEVRKRTWIDRMLEAGIVFGTLGAAGLLAVALGLIPIKASSGHWPVTRWFLEFSMERAFTMQSLRIETPPLESRSLVLRGATQFETACRPCHGAPDLRGPRVAAAMTPVPPFLGDVVPNWKPRELFSIVKHGVKFTGMPGWPSPQRDDEVWAMVAFLVRLPGMTAYEYRQLAFGDMPAEGAAAAPIEMLTGAENLPPRAASERCARCHGIDGRGRETAFPKLAGQHAAYLYNALQAFATGRRHSGIMEPVAVGLSDAELRQLALFYARLDPSLGTREPGVVAAGTSANAAIARGREIVHRGIPSRKVPPCADCHGPTDPHPRHDYPMLAGQHAEYIVLQLELFQKGLRGGSSFAHLMDEVAPRLSERDRRDAAAYYESLR